MKQILFLALAITLFSCKNSSPLAKENLSGYWQQQGEGEIIEINDSLVISYYYSSYNCFKKWEIPRDYFNEETPTLEVIDQNTFRNQGGYTFYTYKKLQEKPSLCRELTEQQRQSNRYNFETLWHTFNEQYAFFKERGVNWAEIKTEYESQFNESTSPFDFYLLMEKMIYELNDEHSDIEVPEDLYEQWKNRNRKVDSTDYEQLSKEKILKKYIQDVSSYNQGKMAWGLLNEKTAYIQFNEMDGLANYKADSMDEYWEVADESDEYVQDLLDGVNHITSKIVNDIKDTEYCIIDLRFNGGGYDQAGLFFFSHFIDEQYDVFTKKRRLGDGFAGNQTIDVSPAKNTYSGKLILLTSPYTVSAAETAILATLNFSNVERIGSNTNGALSDMLVKTLPNGWEYTLSNEVYESMDGKLYEVSGIPPTIRIDYPRDEDEFFKSLYHELETEDRAIEQALKMTK